MTSGVSGSATCKIFTCEYCQQPFERNVYPSLTNYRFCSPTCRNKARIKAPKPPKHCKQCGKELVNPRNIYCSRECAGYSLIGKVSTNPRKHHQDTIQIVSDLYPTTPLDIISELLGMSKSAIRNIAHKHGLKRTKEFMREHLYDPASERMKINNPGAGRPRLKPRDAWRGSNWKQQREKTLKRDGYKCQICHKKVGRKSHDYGIHHIIAFRLFDGDYEQANQLSNLVTLCRHCHDRVDRGWLPCPRPLPLLE